MTAKITVLQLKLWKKLSLELPKSSKILADTIAARLANPAAVTVSDSIDVRSSLKGGSHTQVSHGLPQDRRKAQAHPCAGEGGGVFLDRVANCSGSDQGGRAEAMKEYRRLQTVGVWM